MFFLCDDLEAFVLRCILDERLPLDARRGILSRLHLAQSRKNPRRPRAVVARVEEVRVVQGAGGVHRVDERLHHIVDAQQAPPAVAPDAVHDPGRLLCQKRLRGDVGRVIFSLCESHVPGGAARGAVGPAGLPDAGVPCVVLFLGRPWLKVG